jgi:hypothetical protein
MTVEKIALPGASGHLPRKPDGNRNTRLASSEDAVYPLFALFEDRSDHA